MMKTLRYIFLILIMSVICTDAMAQNDRACIRNGNKLFRKSSYSQAEVQYRKALEINPNNSQAAYNLGCALMMQEKDSAAVEEFQKASKMEKTPFRKAQANHNVGVICQNHKMYAEAIEAYKEALRNNPNDNETRYNLALCKKMLKDNPQQQQDKKDQKKDKNGKDQKDEKQTNKDKQGNKEDKKKDKQNKDNKKDQKDQMSKQNAEQLLKAAIRQEKQTQEKINKMKGKRKIKDLDKNW